MCGPRTGGFKKFPRITGLPSFAPGIIICLRFSGGVVSCWGTGSGFLLWLSGPTPAYSWFRGACRISAPTGSLPLFLVDAVLFTCNRPGPLLHGTLKIQPLLPGLSRCISLSGAGCRILTAAASGGVCLPAMMQWFPFERLRSLGSLRPFSSSLQPRLNENFLRSYGGRAR